MDGDDIFVYATGVAPFENLRENALWQNLEAVRSGNVPVTKTLPSSPPITTSPPLAAPVGSSGK